jgi:hypothetical protein
MVKGPALTAAASGENPRGDSAAIQITNEPMTGSLQFCEYPGDIVRLSCEKCGRSGQYRKRTLIDRYGADIRLPDLREEIAQCRRHGQMRDACMVRYAFDPPRHKAKKSQICERVTIELLHACESGL